MNYKSILFWAIAVIITLASAVFQRMTGPTHPVRGSVEIKDENIRYRLIRSFPRPTDAPIRVEVENREISGYFRYKRTPSFDEWSKEPLVREENKLVAYIPHQPPAGKIAYQIVLQKGEEEVKLTEDPIVIRFRGDVPAWALIPHVIFMFVAMLLSTRAGLAAIAREKTFKLALWTVITFVLGGLVLGPIVQKFAFDAYWTGWPFGTDLTDNKTAVAFVFWAIALFKSWKNKSHRGWVLTASIVLLLIYLIPHSLMGSEIDWTQEGMEVSQ